jgi:hypothetical protein
MASVRANDVAELPGVGSNVNQIVGPQSSENGLQVRPERLFGDSGQLASGSRPLGGKTK